MTEAVMLMGKSTPWSSSGTVASLPLASDGEDMLSPLSAFQMAVESSWFCEVTQNKVPVVYSDKCRMYLLSTPRVNPENL
jgi:hypothetical protein